MAIEGRSWRGLEVSAIRRLSLVCATACVAALATPVVAQAATFTVNTTADSVDAGSCSSTCSLRDAIIAANTGGGSNTITLPAGHYTLSIAASGADDQTTGDLNITSGDTLTITGAGAASTTIDANSIDRAFNIASGASLTLTGATVTGGQPAAANTSGGGLLNAGTLSLSDDVITANQLPSASDGSGGGVENTGTMTVTDSTFSSNSTGASGSGNGGAIHTSGGSLTVTGSTFTANAASSSHCGGALDLDGGTATVTNSTLTGNSVPGTAPCGGAVDIDTGLAVQFNSDTIAFNSMPDDTRGPSSGDGAGVASSGKLTVHFQNTIVAHNTRGSSTGSETQNCDTLTNSNPGNNLDDDSSCFTGAHDVHADPQLSALASNGGPTQTLAIAAGSPARDTGDTGSCPATDQRGVTRPAGSGCDIGAFELVPNSSSSGGGGSPAVATGTSLSASQNPSVVGQPLMLVTVVSPVPNGGTVKFTDQGVPIAGCEAVTVDTGNGQASCTTAFGAPGSYQLQSGYSGAGNFAGSQSAPITQVVGAAGGNGGSGSGGGSGGGGSGGTSTITLGGSPQPTASGVTFTLECSAPAGRECQTTDTLTSTETLQGAQPVAISAAHQPKKHRRTVVVGRRTVTISAGARRTITIKLNATGRKLLARFGKLPVTLTIKLTSNGRTTIVLTRKLTITPKKHKHPHARAERL